MALIRHGSGTFAVSALDWSRDGHTLVSGGYDTYVRGWSGSRGHLLSQVRSAEAARDVADPKGRRKMAEDYASLGWADQARAGFAQALGDAGDDADLAAAAKMAEQRLTEALHSVNLRKAPTPPAAVPVSAESLCRAGQFAEAVKLQRNLLNPTGNASENPFKDDSMDHFTLCSALVASGDHEGYRAACAEMLRRFKETTIVHQAQHTAMACLLRPDSGVDPKTLAALVAVARTGESAPGYGHWVQLLMTLSEYRAGRWDSATDWAAQLAQNPESPERAKAATLAVLAMCEDRRGRRTESKATIAKARETIDANT